MNLLAYDLIIINSSAGKDSQAMLDVIAEQVAELEIQKRVVVVHCDLGRMEWKGTRDLAERQARHYGFRFEVVRRPQGDLLSHVTKRGKWPSSTARYCTSDHKRGQVSTLFTKLVREERASRRRALHCAEFPAVRILNCMGHRAQESPKRAKMQPVEVDRRHTNGMREVTIWRPLLSWTVEQVWDQIRRSGVEHHYAYDLGMPRLSCVFCIFSPKNALLLAGKHNPELLSEYVEVERQIGHTFRKDFRIAEVQTDLLAGVEPGRIQDWVM